MRPQRLVRVVIAAGSFVVPKTLRARWREEWMAEMAHATSVLEHRGNAGRVLVRMAAGSVIDALMLRTLAFAALLSRGSLSRVWQGSGRDVHLGVRSLRTAPGLTLAIVGSLALGIAASATGFSVLQTMFHRPFPHVDDQSRLQHLCVTRDGSSCAASFDDYSRLRDHLDSAVGISASYRVDLAIKLRGASATTAAGAVVSADYFDTLGVRPAVGRFFTPADEAAGWAQPVAVVAHDLWQRGFLGEPAAIGSVLLVNNTAVRIVGVAPRHFVGVNPKIDGYRTMVWVPSSIGDLALRNGIGERVSASTLEPSYKLGLVARMKPGVTPEQLAADASSIAAGFAPGSLRQAPSTGSRGVSRHGTPSVTVRDVFLNDPDKSLPASLAFTGVPAIVLLIACVNAALLLVARAASRGPEWRLRMAIGATRWRLARQLLVEATVLAAASGVSGVLAASALLRLQGRAVPLPLPIDGPVLVFTVAMVVCVTLLFGVGPAWTTATRTTLASRLGRQHARGRMRGLLIGAQAALCVGLLATGAQFLRALNVNMATIGISDPANLIVASFDLEPLHYTNSQTEAFYTELTRRIDRAPGVERAGLSSSDYWGVSTEPGFARFFLPGDEADTPRTAGVSAIAGDLLETLELQLLKGRPLASDNTSGVREILVNEALERMLPDHTALGRTLRIAPNQSPREEMQAEVVGVVAPLPGDARSDNGSRPHLYYASSSTESPARQLYIRAGHVGQSIAGLRRLVEAIDDRVPIEVTTLDQFFATRQPESRWIASSTAGLGLLGLLLTAGGLLGVVSYVVTLRTPEIGVRMALGASQRNVLLLILRQALTPVVVGLMLGSAAAAALGFVTQARLYGSEPVDPVALATGAAVLLCATGLASLIPARRASRIQPNTVLKDTT